MSAVVHLPLLNTQNPYILKDKALDSFTPAFTAVNGRGSPPTPRTSNSSFGMSALQSPAQHDEPRPSETSYHSGSSSGSPKSSNPDSPHSPNKRRRSGTPEERGGAVRAMEAPQHRPLPPMDRSTEHERRWTAEPQSHNGYHEMRDPRPMDQVHGSMPPMAPQHVPMSELNGFEPGSSTDPNRAGSQHIDPKKRKRQFANRTKTGCGTCRRRKKKCDEAKPECRLTSTIRIGSECN
jgi:hypothetical protein